RPRLRGHRCARTALSSWDHRSLHHDPAVRDDARAGTRRRDRALVLARRRLHARNLVAAIGLSVLGGFLIGVVVHAIPRLRRVLDPILTSYYAVPTFVLYPLLIVFFGIGPTSLIVLGALFGIVAMIVATVTAIDRIPRVLLKVARVSR